MSTSVWYSIIMDKITSDFVDKYRKILIERAILSENGLCQLWHSTSKNYGRISIKFDGVCKTVYVHRLSYFINKGDIASLWDTSITFESSHLCHNSLCINADHISLEPKQINNERKICHNKKRCTQHDHYEDCLLHLTQ